MSYSHTPCYEGTCVCEVSKVKEKGRGGEWVGEKKKREERNRIRDGEGRGGVVSMGSKPH